MKLEDLERDILCAYLNYENNEEITLATSLKKIGENPLIMRDIMMKLVQVRLLKNKLNLNMMI